MPAGSAELPWAVAVEPVGADGDAAAVVEVRADVVEPVVFDVDDVPAFDPFAVVVDPDEL